MDNDRFQELVLEHFDKIYMRLDVLERYQLKLDNLIENEVLLKISALFDGQVSHDQRFDRIEEKQASHDQRFDRQDGRLGRVEEKLEDISIDAGYLVARVAELETLAR